MLKVEDAMHFRCFCGFTNENTVKGICLLWDSRCCSDEQHPTIELLSVGASKIDLFLIFIQYLHPAGAVVQCKALKLFINLLNHKRLNEFSKSAYVTNLRVHAAWTEFLQIIVLSWTFMHLRHSLVTKSLWDITGTSLALLSTF